MESSDIAYIREPITYAEFAETYMLKNQPCIFGDWITRDWKGRKDFSQGKLGVNLQAFREIFGHYTDVCVSNCSASDYGYANAEKISMENFLETWKDSTKLYYLKDFHFHRDVPGYKPYEVPIYFQSDWLNEYWDQTTEGGDDFRFIYAGPAGTWTPLHCDVIKSFSWSANLSGIKRWLLFKPGEITKLEISTKQQHEPDMDNLAAIAKKAGAEFFDMLQQPGEIIFVPSEWGHQVRNETDVVSLNHNWLNAFNASICCKNLLNEWKQTEAELRAFGVEGCLNDKIEHIIHSSAGCGIKTFVDLLVNISCKRLVQVTSKSVFKTMHDVLIDRTNINPGDADHAVLDLISIMSVISGIISHLPNLDFEIKERLECTYKQISESLLVK